MSHKVRLAPWRFEYDTKQNSSDWPRSERRQEINVRPESGVYPKGDTEVVDTEHNPEFHQVMAQGVDLRIRDSEHDSEHERIKRSSDESGSTEKLTVPLRKLIVGTEHLG